MPHRLILLFLLIPTLLHAQKPKPGIGLALAGGGAKGLAHIGILKAIDSAELNIDYLSGTSIGSIVGGLYAAGYSGDSIETIARQINWGTLLTNSIPMSSYIMEEKSEYGKYAVELSVRNGKVSLPSGFLESQELWMTLEKFFFPVADVQDFNKLSIPFRCVGTDLATGDAIVFSNGSLVRSIRASMAVPGAFSPVEFEGKRLVDGGITRNFPVKDLRDMGATYRIGVSVSTPIQDASELDNMMTVFSQVMFMNENKDRIEESKLAQLLINVPMGTYTSASFDEADAIIELGIREGRKYYPEFKRLADSLRAAHPDYQFRKNRLPAVDSFRLSNIEVIGLSSREKEAFLEQTNLDTSKVVTVAQLEKKSRQAYAYRMYKSIVYEMQPDGNGGRKIVYRVKPESPLMLKAGISENAFTGFGVHLNLTARNKLTKFSRSMVSANLGENFRLLAEHLQMFGYARPWSNRFQFYHEIQRVPVFTNFNKTGEYRFRYFTLDNRFQLSAKRRSAGGIGLQWELIKVQPEFFAGKYYSGNNNFFQAYGFWQYNTLNKPQYARKGTMVELKAAYLFSVDPRLRQFEDGVFITDITKDNIVLGNYARLTAHYFNVAPLAGKWSLVSRMQAGINFSKNMSLFNEFYAGGMNPTFRNQIMFVGLQEGEVSSESMAAAQAGLRYNPFGSLYVTAQGSALAYDFIQKTSRPVESKWLFGGGLTLAYDLPIGPIEFTLMFTNKTQGMRSYFNLGFPFKL